MANKKDCHNCLKKLYTKVGEIIDNKIIFFE